MAEWHEDSNPHWLYQTTGLSALSLHFGAGTFLLVISMSIFFVLKKILRKNMVAN